MDPLATSPTATAAAGPAPATGAGPSTPSASSKHAFQMALSAALNPPNVLGGAGGDDGDDDDGSLLTVGNAVHL